MSLDLDSYLGFPNTKLEHGSTAPHILILALYGDEWFAFYSDCFYPQRTSMKRRLGGPKELLIWTWWQQKKI
jgi:hypothetical protein